MKIVKEIKEMTLLVNNLKKEGQTVVFVPTMGYLHEGHLSLVREGKKRGHILVVSIFVNPTQFNDKNDFQVYPVDIERDSRLLEKEGCDILFLPHSESMYPEGFQTTIDVSELSKGMCGDSRPGHFSGVATVVAKLFNIVKPDVSIFGEKDYQQLALIRQMVRDLNFDIDIVGMPIVRESDGLAMSSRNVRLTTEERKLSLSLSKALLAGNQIFRDGNSDASAIIESAKGELAEGVELDYIDIRDTLTLKSIKKVNGEALMAIAARVGKTRLIDNTILRRN